MTTATEEKPILVWDTCEIARQQAEYLQEQDPTLTDDEAFRKACEDPDLIRFEWEYLCDELTEVMKDIDAGSTGGWIVRVDNFGWRGQSGMKVFHGCHEGQELLREILPKTECSFKIYKRGQELAINNAHHDSPCWKEWYYVKAQRGD